MNLLKEYYKLAKPGIIYGNLLTTLAAFLFASRWDFRVMLFFATVFGISLVIGSACVFNNYLDREIDKKMERTRSRALAVGRISGNAALIYGTVLGLIGFVLLYMWVNALTMIIALIGFVFYVIFYGLAKRASWWGTIVGSVSGAVPIVVGYTAVTNQCDYAALILFLVLVVWQMPHFYAIAMYRLADYTEAGIPVLPAQKGLKATKVQIIWYCLAFLVATALLTLSGYAGNVYLGVMLVTSLVWLWRAAKSFKAVDDAKWGKSFFLSSLIVLLIFSAVLSLASVLP